jgi:Flp pilus assembly protein TadG
MFLRITALTRARIRVPRLPANGQSLTEFALLLPLMLLLVVAVADFGRLFTSMIAVESAAREGADFGAMQGKLKWDSTNTVQLDQNISDMKVRACSAAASLSDYAGDPPGTVNMTCTNPTFTFDLERVPVSGNCALQGEFDDPCIVHVTMTYDFHMFLNLGPLPSILHVTRESRFAISDLGA